MRKQDRIAREQGREPAAQDANEQHDSKDREQVKGGRPADGPQKPREPGKLPLPE
jgi:hypothetical protein